MHVDVILATPINNSKFLVFKLRNFDDKFFF